MAMAILTPLHSTLLSSPPPRPSFSPRRCRRAVALSAKAATGGGGTALVWFKRDLRTDDHPGLADAVARSKSVVPLYVFDARILSGYSDEMLEQLLFALEDLKKLLIDQGSDLLITFGSAEAVILGLVNKVKATHIFAEEEVDYDLRRLTNTVESSLSATSFTWGIPKFCYWRTPFYDIKNLKELSVSYRDFQKIQQPVTIPFSAPTLPILDMELENGILPTFSELKKQLCGETWQAHESWISLKKISAISKLSKEGVKPEESNAEILREPGNTRKKTLKSVFASPKSNKVTGGTKVALNGLAAYLRYLEGTARDDWQEVHEKSRLAESRRGASFNTLFGSALYLGVVSRRRVYYEAIQYEKQRNAGFISPFGYSTPTVAAAVEAVCSMEWYSLLAWRSQVCNDGICPSRIWRWNDYLVQYTVVGHEGPAVLLVHGFGAFLEHFRSNISSIADDGHRVWAVTLLGFGKSEKPNIVYTELLWAQLLRDFIVDVVGEPVHLVGNSLGGYFAAIVSGIWPAVAKSVVLMNTAGSVVQSYSSIPLNEAGQSSGIVTLLAPILLLYLRLRARDILKNYYPTNKGRIDNWFISEVLRASYDPGVPIVLESILNIKLSIPLNYLFDSFGGRVLIVQGMRDPLRNSNSFLSMIKDHCSGISIRELDAGHCPHDERPAEVNALLCEWIRMTETSLLTVQQA